MKKSLIFLMLVSALSSVACFEDQDDNVIVASASEINDFIYRGLNFFYLYKADTPELADDFFASDEAYTNFLNEYSTPEAFFDYLTSSQDRFSILVDDYVELENSLAGISLNNGMEFGLVLYPDQSGNVFGYVRYVLPNTDASQQGLTRGVIFNTVDGQQITDTNFSTIFEPTTYTIGLANFDGNTVTPTGEEITLTKAEYTENPIFVTNTFNINGRTIGYLMYNAFTNEFDSQLNALFGQFISEGITDLVLDLRYNSGGSVRTANYLSSMITGQNTGQVFYSEQWNADRQQEYAQNGLFLDSFVNGGESINSLMLNEVYVLTSSRTASASELVINGLSPYINVVQIGDDTSGKFQASFLLYDAPAPNFSRAEANINHTYAMLPLVFKTANADGFTDFINGLVPDIEQKENYANLGILGDADEPLLATAIAQITGLPMPTVPDQPQLEVLSERKAELSTYQIMYVED